MTLLSSDIGSTGPKSFPENAGAAAQAARRVSVNGPRFPNAQVLPFRSFNNRYKGQTCYVVGRGPTDFDYRSLADIAEPIFFINDAICLEKHARSETFFFAHDIHMRVWLDGLIRATAVLPIEGLVFGPAPSVELGHAGPLVYYHRGERSIEQLLRTSRDEVSELEELFVHSGTIHSLLHFIWFCGFRRVVYIGCDGINEKEVLRSAVGTDDGYDPRLQNWSKTSPTWEYTTIRWVQDLLMALFRIEAVYLGTPVC